MCGNGYLVAEGHGRGTKYHIPQARKASGVSDNLGSKPKRKLGRDELRKVILDVCDEWVLLNIWWFYRFLFAI